jgi:2-polyprenyl-3-methyl-5-hydroxy-6-metoxy-1,4-benzoquinol methylase
MESRVWSSFARWNWVGRYLPPSPADVLDVGGGPGVYASRLAHAGYRVNLIDLLPLHVEQAAAELIHLRDGSLGFSAR